MGHLGSTYERYYIPTHIARDYQSIYFGSPSQDLLIKSVARMGLSRDRRAPTELDDDQLEEVRNNPELRALRDEREEYKNRIYGKGLYPVTKAKGTKLYQQYKETKRNIGTTYQRLQRERLMTAIREFHDSIDTIEIARQLSGKGPTEVLTLPRVEFELRERATIAGMLFAPFKNEKAWVKFIENLARLCHRQETAQRKPSKRKKIDFVVFESEKTSQVRKRKDIGLKSTLNHQTPDHVSLKEESPDNKDCGTVRQELGTSDAAEAETVQLYPMELPHPVCLICIGNDEFSYEKRMRHIPRKDVLKKHVETHFRLPEYQTEFQCRHPECSIKLGGMMHFKRHAFDVHGVSH